MERWATIHTHLRSPAVHFLSSRTFERTGRTFKLPLRKTADPGMEPTTFSLLVANTNHYHPLLPLHPVVWIQCNVWASTNMRSQSERCTLTLCSALQPQGNINTLQVSYFPGFCLVGIVSLNRSILSLWLLPRRTYVCTQKPPVPDCLAACVALSFVCPCDASMKRAHVTAGMYCDAELLSVHICSWRFRQIGAQGWKRAAVRSGKPSGLLLLLAKVQAEVQGPRLGPPLITVSLR